MSKIRKRKDLSDSLKIFGKAFYEESGYTRRLPITFYRTKKFLFTVWYFEFPSVTAEDEVVGPFISMKSAKKYAESIMINGKFTT